MRKSYGTAEEVTKKRRLVTRSWLVSIICKFTSSLLLQSSKKVFSINKTDYDVINMLSDRPNKLCIISLAFSRLSAHTPYTLKQNFFVYVSYKHIKLCDTSGFCCINKVQKHLKTLCVT